MQGGVCFPCGLHEGGLVLLVVFWFHVPSEQGKNTIEDEDNEGAIHLANIGSAQSKHIDARSHLIRNGVKEGRIAITPIRSQNHFADIMTNPPP